MPAGMEPMTPTPPPEVTGQSKPDLPFAGVGPQMANQGNRTTVRFEALKKVLDSWSQEDPKMAPYAKRALDILQSGMEASQGQQTPGAAGPKKADAPPETFPG